MHDSAFPLNANETIIRIVHRHIINFVPVIVAAAIVLVSLAVASAAVAANTATIVKFASPVGVQTAIMIVALLVTLGVLLAFLIYRQNRIIVTNQNLCQIEQFGLFGRTTAKLNLNDVQDVTGRRIGILATLLDYGDLVVETAGEQENFIFKQAPHPAELAAQINQTYREFCEMDSAAKTRPSL